LDEVEKNRKSQSNLTLKDGDILTIPERPTTIAVRGSVTLPSTLIFEKGKTLDYYLAKCGGSTIDADTTQVLVIRATGTITKARGSTRIELGDAIFVPTRVMVAKLTDASSTFDSAIKSLTNAGIVWALISRLL
jgi:protein involved in polysaccharide export with SLBB domain